MGEGSIVLIRQIREPVVEVLEIGVSHLNISLFLTEP